MANVESRVAACPLWYHTIELAPDVVTPGWFDLRPIVDRMPWPDVAGKRCLDVGTWDGFLAFELERRGAAEVVATDIPSHESWDHTPRDRGTAIAFHEATVGTKGEGFRIAAEALGSAVRHEWINVYDLSPERVGDFDVVVCGSLLLHLQRPFDALEALRSVCRGVFLSSEHIDPALTIRVRRRPAMFIDGQQGRWLVPNRAGHARMLEVAGFDVLRRSRPYAIPYGPSHPHRAGRLHDVDPLIKKVVTRGDPDGVLHAAVLCRPAL